MGGLGGPKWNKALSPTIPHRRSPSCRAWPWAEALLCSAWPGSTFATFRIIPHFAAQAYGISQTPYTARYGLLGDSFGSVLKSLLTRPGLVASVVAEPLRLSYLFGLAAPTALLALFGPELLLLSLPLLLANLLSAFPLQYSGELHYSAPLVPYFILAAAAGVPRLLDLSIFPTGPSSAFAAARRWVGRVGLGSASRQSAPAGRTSGHEAADGASRGEVLHASVSYPWAPGGFRAPDGRPVARVVVALAAIAAAALGYQIAAGFTPLGQGYRLLVPGGWPQTTAHDRLLSRFSSQIPAGASLSVSSDLYPHVSHRQLLYQFPVIGQAAWVLVDVSGTTDRPATDVHQALLGLLQAGWGVADAADGYVLLARDGGAKSAELPGSFYDFARASTSGPAHALDFTFGGRLELLGYDVVDDPKWRRSGLRYFWRALKPLPAGVAISVQVVAPDGSVVDDRRAAPNGCPCLVPTVRLAARRDHRHHLRSLVFALRLGAGRAGDQGRPGVGAYPRARRGEGRLVGPL